MCDECALRFYVCSIFVDRVFVPFIFHHGVHWTFKCFAYVAPRGWIWVRRGLCGFGDIRGSVGRYDPWGIKATGFAVTTKINHYAAVTVVGAVDGRCWDRLARSSGLLYPAWVLSAVRRGKQRQFVCWIQVRTTDGKVKLAKCLIDNGSEVNLVREGFLQGDEAKMSSTPVQLEGVSGHRLEGGDREAELAVRLVKQSVWSVEETVTEAWFSGKLYEATIKYDLFLGQPWLHAHRVSPMGHRTCFLQDPSTSDPSDLYYLHPYTKSIHQFKEQNKLHIQQDGQEWTGNQEEFDEGKVESLNCKKWKSVCYRVVDKWRDILVDYFERNHNFRPQVDAFANKKNKRFPKFYDDAWSEDWSEPLWINPPFDVFLVWCRS